MVNERIEEEEVDLCSYYKLDATQWSFRYGPLGERIHRGYFMRKKDGSIGMCSPGCIVCRNYLKRIGLFSGLVSTDVELG